MSQKPAVVKTGISRIFFFLFVCLKQGHLEKADVLILKWVFSRENIMYVTD